MAASVPTNNSKLIYEEPQSTQPKPSRLSAIQNRVLAATARIMSIKLTFDVTPLSEEEKTVTLPVYLKRNRETRFETVPRRCNVCLDPATHKQSMNRDENYVRYLCVEHAKKEASTTAVLQHGLRTGTVK